MAHLERGESYDREEGSKFQPKFGADGLATCVTIDAARGDVLMVAHMNEAALRATLGSGIVHYWSRSRGSLWRKGDTSGQTQRLIELRVDCDQDAFLAFVEVGGDGGACHTGRRSCFYRRVETAGRGTAARVHRTGGRGRLTGLSGPEQDFGIVVTGFPIKILLARGTLNSHSLANQRMPALEPGLAGAARDRGQTASLHPEHPASVNSLAIYAAQVHGREGTKTKEACL